MSEYQYYEFAAIDRTLSRKQMAELRAVSTRAVISYGSSVNHYEWGGLERFLAPHAKRKALLQRLTQAGLWKQ